MLSNNMIFFCVGVVYSGEYDACDVTLSVYPYSYNIHNFAVWKYRRSDERWRKTCTHVSFLWVLLIYAIVLWQASSAGFRHLGFQPYWNSFRWNGPSSQDRRMCEIIWCLDSVQHG
jgi:hypothetical protein